MLVFMEPYVNVIPKVCSLLPHAMDQIQASGQACITQQLVLPHVETFSYIPLLWITGKIIGIIVLALIFLLLLLPLLSGGPNRLLCDCLAVGLLRARWGVGLLHARLGVGLLHARLGVSLLSMLKLADLG